MKTKIIAVLGVMAILAWAQVQSQTNAPAASSSPVKGPREFPADKGFQSAQKHNHQTIVLRVAWGYKGDYHDPANFYLGITYSRGSSGAPKLAYGDDYSEVCSQLLDEGYQIQFLQFDGGEWGYFEGNAVFVK